VTILTFVDVKSGTQLATVSADGDTVTYDGGDFARSVVGRYAEDAGLDPADAVCRLAVGGWSNGYIMIALPELEGDVEPEPIAESAGPAPPGPQPLVLAESTFNVLAA
jgi:hypothetical protein